jgi:hypothetical protein
VLADKVIAQILDKINICEKQPSVIILALSKEIEIDKIREEGEFRGIISECAATRAV